MHCIWERAVPMKIQQNGLSMNGYQTSNDTVLGNSVTVNKQQNQPTVGIIDGSELNLGNTSNSLTELLKQKLQVQAQMDTMEKDQEFYDELDERKSKIETLGDDKTSYEKEIKKIDSMNKELKEMYGIQDGSREEENLNLLIRKINGEVLTKEEYEQIQELELTEYQKAVLDNEYIKKDLKTLIKDIDDSIIEEKAIVKGMEWSRIGVNPMDDTKRELKDIMKALDEQIKKQITGELLIEEDIKGIFLDEEV